MIVGEVGLGLTQCTVPPSNVAPLPRPGDYASRRSPPQLPVSESTPAKVGLTEGGLGTERSRDHVSTQAAWTVTRLDKEEK